ncbi:hypothetical protein [Rhodopirellula baltica]|uniref:hypothetical protein n=1 Tax=Rhodopirellula baltica TaxID=265606 RepID=UPI0011466021|nr:hypothetical protein [Rhodopirellula baltica]
MIGIVEVDACLHQIEHLIVGDILSGIIRCRAVLEREGATGITKRRNIRENPLVNCVAVTTKRVVVSVPRDYGLGISDALPNVRDGKSGDAPHA